MVSLAILWIRSIFIVSCAALHNYKLVVVAHDNRLSSGAKKGRLSCKSAPVQVENGEWECSDEEKDKNEDDDRDGDVRRRDKDDDKG